MLEIQEYLLLLCGGWWPKSGPVIHQHTFHAIDGHQQIWLAVVAHVNETQCHHRLVGVGTQDAGGDRGLPTIGTKSWNRNLAQMRLPEKRSLKGMGKNTKRFRGHMLVWYIVSIVE